MWTYSTNMMGVFGIWWYKENNIPFTISKRYSKYFDKEIEFTTYEQWYGGRIDCYCDNTDDVDYDIYGTEVSLPIMDSQSYSAFSDWLDSVKTDRLYMFEELQGMFERMTNTNLRLWYDGMYKGEQ